MKPIQVIKRNGSKEELNIEKIQTQITRACEGISDVSPSMIELAAKIQFVDGMTTETIDKLLLKAMVDLIDMEANPETGHVNYQFVAGKQRLRMLRKDVYGGYEPHRLYDIVKANVKNNRYDTRLLEWYTEEEWDTIDSFIDHTMDEKYSYSALEQLIEKYLVQNRATKVVAETPQIRYAVAAATAFHMEEKSVRLNYVKDYYRASSRGHFTLATPVLAGLGTPTNQFSSCVLLTSGDSLNSIFSTGEMMAKYAAKRAGIGLEIGKIRGLDAPIRNGELSHTGLVPFLKKWFSDLRSCCLRPDMLVEIEIDDSTKMMPISDVRVGMRIKSNDNGTVAFKTVTDVFNTTVPANDQVMLTFENGTTINCSNNHPIMVWNGGEIIEVLPTDLTEDHRIITPNGFTRILACDVGQNNDPNYVDITVEDTHTFYTTDNENNEQILTHNSQGGIRNSSASVNLPIWHYQFDDFIVLKNNQGTEETRVRHMDYTVVLNAMFFRRLKNEQNITFFDPYDVPDLYDAFYRNTEEFEELYVKYEKRTDIRKKVVPAVTVFKDWILKERTDTGRIYLVFIDNVINQTPFDTTIDPIVQSNLCLTGDTTVEVYVDGEEKTLRIDEITALDTNVLVKTKNIDTDEIVYSSVVNAGITGETDELIEISDDSGKTIRCTLSHEIYTKNRGWVEAQYLEETDILDTITGFDAFTVKKITLDETISVYDLTVANTHAFYANDILVHNCLEILLPTRPFERLEDENGRIALCTLGSMNWGAFRKPEDMKIAARILVRALSNILSFQDFLSIQSKLANDEFMPLGIGVTNLAYWHAQRNYKYGDDNALSDVKRWMEHQAYYLTDASADLAKERGSCQKSHTTAYGKGIFPWEKRAKGSNDLTDFTPELDWEPLREKLLANGIKNATLMAIAPVESCQSKNNLQMLSTGEVKSLGELLDNSGLDVASIEETGEQGWYDLPNSFTLMGRENPEEVNKVWYNGMAETYLIQFEDGSEYEFTGNHRLLSNGEWLYVRDIVEGDTIDNIDGQSKIVYITSGEKQHTWDVSTPSETFVLGNGCISHNSSVVINSTNGIEMPMALISSKESKAGSLVQVVPEYTRLKNRYQLMWEQKDCIEYLKTAAVLNVYCDQSISTNTFYSPKNYPDGKIPSTLITKNIMLFHYWGGKTFYYSLVEKLGSKIEDEDVPLPSSEEVDGDDDCEACKL